MPFRSSTGRFAVRFTRLPASPTASHEPTPRNTVSHFLPLWPPIVVSLHFLSRGISHFEKVFLNRSDSAPKNFSPSGNGENHKLLWRAFRARRRLAVRACENANLFCKSQQPREADFRRGRLWERRENLRLRSFRACFLRIPQRIQLAQHRLLVRAQALQELRIVQRRLLR